MSSANWCLIESDPAVFTELVDKVGVKGVSVEEMIMLEESELTKFDNVYGLIFLFKWQAQERDAAGASTSTAGTVMPDAPLYFAKQTVNNACATVALVNTLCNYGDKVDLGDAMSNFHAFTQDLDPETRGQQIEEFEPLRTAHNSFAPVQVFEFEGAAPKDKDVYHFVSFIYKNGAVWQLDGLKEGPVLCAPATDENYKSVMVDVVQLAIADVAARDNSGLGQGISFALMAVVDDPLVKLREQVERLTAQEKPVPASVREEIEDYEKVRERGRVENIRRRHNYMPTVVALLKALAEKGELDAVLAEVRASKPAAATGGAAGGN